MSRRFAPIEDDHHYQSNEPVCYIRRNDRQGWVRARPHHQAALALYQRTLESYVGEQDHQPIRVSTPHVDGGDFIAEFTRCNDVISVYHDEYGNHVEIAMMTPSYAGFINRVIDH